jgi:hypothetical protein
MLCKSYFVLKPMPIALQQALYLDHMICTNISRSDLDISLQNMRDIHYWWFLHSGPDIFLQNMPYSQTDHLGSGNILFHTVYNQIDSFDSDNNLLHMTYSLIDHLDFDTFPHHNPYSSSYQPGSGIFLSDKLYILSYHSGPDIDLHHNLCNLPNQLRSTCQECRFCMMIYLLHFDAVLQHSSCTNLRLTTSIVPERSLYTNRLPW